MDELTEGGFYSGEITLLTGPHPCIDTLLSSVDCSVSKALIRTGGQFEGLVDGDLLRDEDVMMVMNVSDIFECFDSIEELKREINLEQVKLVVVGCVMELFKALSNVKLKAEMMAKMEELIRAVRRVCACNVCVLLCTCDGDNSKVDRSINEALIRLVDNAIQLKEQHNAHNATIIKSNKTFTRETVLTK